MKILFLDQSGKLGGAELSLLDLAAFHHNSCLVGLLADGLFRQRLEELKIPVQVLTEQSLSVHKDSTIWQGFASVGQLLPLGYRVAVLSRAYDVIYANTQKAFVVGAIASLISRRPLVYHLRDILSTDHFSTANMRVAVTLANRCASLVITNSHATRDAFIQAGGRAELATVVYNGFALKSYQNLSEQAAYLRQELRLTHHFVVGHFSRLSPWKGQHILIDALKSCPENVVALIVGDALFGEQQYVSDLHQQVERQGLQHRVHFLGFRSDISALMAACDLVAHTSTSPEPFGRVIVEAMLCGTPVVAAAAGGAMELVEHGKTGWLAPPGDADKLAAILSHSQQQPDLISAIAQVAQQQAIQKFDLNSMNYQIQHLIQSTLKNG